MSSSIITIADLCKYVATGVQPVITFKRGANEKEAYAEPGMRARILSIMEKADCLVILFDFEEFDSFNKPLESRNYYDQQGQPTLNAREAGYYTPQDSLYFESDALMADELEFVDDLGQALYAEYKKSDASRMSYTTWLERQLVDRPFR